VRRRAAACDVPAAGTGRLPAPPEPEERVIDIYFDFTCPYSRRTGRWWRELDEPARWRPFLLREVNRDDDGPAEWDREDALVRVSVLALALHEAVEAAGGDVGVYRWTAMELFERGTVEGQQLRELAARVLGRELDDEVMRAALRSVGQSHEQALSLKVFGTPTLVSGGASTYLKLTEQPTPARTRPVYDALMAVLTDTPEIGEIKRPG
jgi:hypothetical protein